MATKPGKNSIQQGLTGVSGWKQIELRNDLEIDPRPREIRR